MMFLQSTGSAILATLAVAGVASAQSPTFTLSFSNSSSTITSSSSTVSSLTSTSSTISSTPVALPSVTTLPYSFILGVDRAPAGGVVKRQTSGFVGGAGPVNPTSCSLATPFNLVNGQLVSGGQVISTDPGVPYIPLFVSGTPGTITTTFGLVGDVVEWVNPLFFGGVAGFCQDLSGQVYATFAGAADVPAGCGAVDLVAYPATQCVNGELVADTATLTLPAGIYFPTETPAADCCSPLFESWIVGQTTLLP